MNTVECPQCGKVLKTSNPIAPGKKVRCPGCKAVFTMPAAKVASSTALRAKSAAAVPKRPSVDDDDDLPPPKRKRREEEDEDIEDRDAEDEDEEERRPKKKKKKKKQADMNWPLVGGGAGVAVVILFLVAGFVWPGFFRSAGGGGGGAIAAALPAGTGQENLLAYMPSNGQFFFGVDATKNAEMAKAFQEGVVAKFQEQMQQVPAAGMPAIPAGLGGGLDESLRDAQRLVVGFGNTGPETAMACAVSTGKAIDVQKIVKAFNAEKISAKEHQGRPYYNLPDGPQGGPPLWLGVANTRVLLIAVSGEEDFKRLLTSEGQVPLPPDAQALVSSVSKSYMWAAGVIAGDLSARLQMLDAKDLAIVPELVPALDALKQIKGASFSADESSAKDQKITIALTCANDTDAVVVSGSLNKLWTGKGKKYLQLAGFMALQPGNEGLGDLVNDVNRSFKIENKGPVALASVTITEKTVKKMEQMQKQMMQNFGGMNPGGQPPGIGVPKDGLRPKGPGRPKS